MDALCDTTSTLPSMCAPVISSITFVMRCASAIAVSQRMTNVIEEITGAHMDGNVLVVSHKASIRVLLCALLGIDVGRFRYRLGCPVGSVSIVEFGGHGPLASAVADRSHLDARLRGLDGS